MKANAENRRETLPSQGQGALTLTLATTLQEVLALRESWSSLRAQHGLAGAADPDRFAAELHAAGPGTSPYVVLLRDGNQPRGMIIGRIARQRLICRIGYWRIPTPYVRCLDIVYNGCVHDGAAGVCTSIARHLQELLERKAVDVITLNHLSVEDGLYALLARGRRVRTAQEPHWRLALVPGSFEQTLAWLSSKHRSTLRRKDKTLVGFWDRDVLLRVFDRPEDLDECIQGTAGIAAQTYQAGLGCHFADTPLWRAILETEALLGRLRCYCLLCVGRPIAFQVGMIYDDRYSLCFMGHLPEYAKLSPGLVLHMRIIEELCRAGVVEYDYGFGDADYKRLYGSRCCEEGTLQIYARSLRARSVLALQAWTTASTKVTKRCLRAVGLWGWLKRQARRRRTGTSDPVQGGHGISQDDGRGRSGRCSDGG